jgi:hypothetical protein
MPAINQSFLLSLQDDYTKFPCFIETGTCWGETVSNMEPYFNNIYTIEFSEMFYKRTKNKYAGTKIIFLLGDSSIVFETLLPTIEEPTIFFLDGHWSQNGTGKSAKDCPLDEEITHINNLFKNEAIIIIDDYRLFGTNPEGGEDWSQISKENLIKILSNRISKVYHLPSTETIDDRLLIHINPISPII